MAKQTTEAYACSGKTGTTAYLIQARSFSFAKIWSMPCDYAVYTSSAQIVGRRLSH